MNAQLAVAAHLDRIMFLIPWAWWWSSNLLIRARGESLDVRTSVSTPAADGLASALPSFFSGDLDGRHDPHFSVWRPGLPWIRGGPPC